MNAYDHVAIVLQYVNTEQGSVSSMSDTVAEALQHPISGGGRTEFLVSLMRAGRCP